MEHVIFLVAEVKAEDWRSGKMPTLSRSCYFLETVLFSCAIMDINAKVQQNLHPALFFNLIRRIW